MKPFFGSCLVSLNSLFPKEQKILINGIVEDKIYVKGYYKSPGKYSLNVKTSNSTYKFESRGDVIDTIEIGDKFNQKMNKGFLGILYK